MTKEDEMLALADEIERSTGLYCIGNDDSEGRQLGIKKTAMVIEALRAAADPSPDAGLVDFARDLAARQEPLGADFAKVLHDNSWELYEEMSPDAGLVEMALERLCDAVMRDVGEAKRRLDAQVPKDGPATPVSAFLSGLAIDVGKARSLLSHRRDAGAGEVVAWREVEMIRLIDLLRSQEGDSVTILCDNPDFNGQPNCAVICNGEWTGWQDRRFAQDTMLNTLSAAMIEYKRPRDPDETTPAPQPGRDPATIEVAASIADAIADEPRPDGRNSNYWRGRRYGAQRSAFLIRAIATPPKPD